MEGDVVVAGVRTGAAKRPKKVSLSQADVPSYPLSEALRVPQVIAHELGKRPSTPLQVAKALGMAPTTSGFRVIAGSSLAYGLTDGGAFADKIGLTDLGRRSVAPTVDGDDRIAKVEAAMKPRVTREFLARYNGSKWPRDDIGRNVLEDDFGVDTAQSGRALELIRKDAEYLNVLVRINEALFVSLDAADPVAPKLSEMAVPLDDDEPSMPDEVETSVQRSEEILAPKAEVRRVFITHGRNQKIVEQIKKLLGFGDFEAVVSVETQATAKPVPDKVMDEMRSCSAAIVHVGSEMVLSDKEDKEHRIINSNVLIEIGAAMALYGRRFILLVERGVTLPSNLQGLYEVRYEGDGLDHESTMALLEAFSGFKGSD